MARPAACDGAPVAAVVAPGRCRRRQAAIAAIAAIAAVDR